MPYLVDGLLDVRAKLALRDGLVVETVPCASVLRPSAPEHESAAAEGRHSPDQTAMIGSIPTSSKNSRYSSRPRPLGAHEPPKRQDLCRRARANGEELTLY